jgi:hypothetical protein
MKKYLLTTLTALACSTACTLLVTGASPVQAGTITFDDLSDNGFGTPITNGYQGLNWANFQVLNTPANALFFGTSGAQAGTVSPPNIAFDTNGDLAVLGVSRPSTFTLNSFHLTAFYNDGLNVKIEGFSGGTTGTLLDDVTKTISSTASTLITLNWTGIDTVSFFPSGGTHNPNYSGAGTQFALDNLTITPSVVPLPAALPLFATGLGALGLLGWRRKRKATAIA